MDTRPGHAQMVEPQSPCDARMEIERGLGHVRDRATPSRGATASKTFVEARKRDDGDAVRIAEER